MVLVSCGGIPRSALQISEASLETRQLQTRAFDTSDEQKLLIAAASLLQDEGYQIDESEVPLGLIVASKERDATDGGQVAGAIFVALFTGVATAIDDEQRIRVSIITTRNGPQTSLRATFQRIVWNNRGQISKLEMITDKDMYAKFFARLSKAVFLEANEI